MKKFQSVLIAFVALLVLAGSAEASMDLWTIHLFAESDYVVGCRLVNTTTRTIPVTIRVYDGVGTLERTQSFTLAPYAMPAGLDMVGPGNFACRFTVPSKYWVRAGAVIYLNTSGSATDTMAVPAQ